MCKHIHSRIKQLWLKDMEIIRRKYMEIMRLKDMEIIRLKNMEII